jgi:hypothetical protein
MIEPLKIATWNANWLIKHLQEIKTFIFKYNQNIDMLLVSEHISLTRVIVVFFGYFWVDCISHNDGTSNGKAYGRNCSYHKKQL